MWWYSCSSSNANRCYVAIIPMPMYLPARHRETIGHRANVWRAASARFPGAGIEKAEFADLTTADISLVLYSSPVCSATKPCTWLTRAYSAPKWRVTVQAIVVFTLRHLLRKVKDRSNSSSLHSSSQAIPHQKVSDLLNCYISAPGLHNE